MLECDIELTFQVLGPYLSRSTTSGGYGVDATPLRDRQRRPLLPGSHVRGRIRESLTDLWQAVSRPANAEEWLGPPTDRDGVEPANGLRQFGWQFGDFVGPVSTADERVLTRIALDSESGVVKTGAMQVIECAVSPGDEANFSGCVTVSASNEVGLAEAIRWLQLGAACVPSVGAFRNVGFGRVTSVSSRVVAIRVWNGNANVANLGAAGTKVSTPLAPLSAPSPSRAATRRLRVKLAEPFCVGGKRRDRNTTTSLWHLPGAVLKGAVAHLLQRIHGLDHRADISQAKPVGRWQTLSDRFSGIRFCAAFPVQEGATSRPVVQPLSLFTVGSSPQLHDAAFYGEAIERAFVARVKEKADEPAKWRAPAFAPDWKDRDPRSGWESGLADPDVELRVRTRIDAQARRAHDEHLFAMELVQPDGLDWLGAIDLHAVPAAEQSQLWDDLEALFDVAVLRIGKTKARATFAFEDAAPDPQFSSSSIPHQGRWIVVLQSPALLLNPKQLHRAWTTGEDATVALYGQIFDALSGGLLNLRDHFTSEQLQGGFLAIRGRSNLIGGPPGKYAPLLTTEPGSVFVLEAKPDKQADAQAVVERWLKTGLPQPEWAKREYGECFSTNPFLPQDGCGEIAVNIPRQLALEPKQLEIKTL